MSDDISDDIRVSFDPTEDPRSVKVTLLINNIPRADQYVSADNLHQFLQAPDGNYTIYLTEPR
jgi:hypothetical protein